MGGGRLALFSQRRKCRRCCVYLESDVVLLVQVRSSVMCTPRNLVLLTLHSRAVDGQVGWSPEFLMKSITTSFALLTLRDRLFAPHHSASCATSSRCCWPDLCVIGKLDDVVGAELGSAVVGQQREEQRAEHTALWGTCAQCGILDRVYLTSAGDTQLHTQNAKCLTSLAKLSTAFPKYHKHISKANICKHLCHIINSC